MPSNDLTSVVDELTQIKVLLEGLMVIQLKMLDTSGAL